MGSAGAEALANALRENRTLKTLGLGENDIGNHGGKRINESLKYNNVITDIFLEGNRMSERIVDEVCRRCDRTEHEPQECKFSCGSSVDPLEDLDASTVMSSVTSSYARRMLESIEEESEEDQDDEESDSDDSSTVFDHDISCMIADMTTRATRRKNDRLGKLKSSFVRILHRGRREVAHR